MQPPPGVPPQSHAPYPPQGQHPQGHAPYPPQGQHPQGHAPYPPQGQQPYGAPPPKKSGTSWVVVIVVMGVVGIFVVGVFAAIAIPAFTKYMRKSKTSEARTRLAAMFDGASAYYSEHGKCPDYDGAQGEAGVTPPFSVNCNEGQAGKCSPGGAGEGAYPQTSWTDSEVWSGLGFEMSSGHYFHYNFQWTEKDGGCQFTAQAFGDLDDDGMFSTFERSGAADVNGVNGAAGLYIDREME